MRRQGVTSADELMNPAEVLASPRDAAPLLLDAEQAAQLLGMSRTTFYRCDIKGLVPMAVRLGGLRRWPRAELFRWVESGCPPRHKWMEMKK